MTEQRLKYVLLGLFHFILSPLKSRGLFITGTVLEASKWPRSLKTIDSYWDLHAFEIFYSESYYSHVRRREQS